MKFIYTIILALIATYSLHAQNDKLFWRNIFSKEISFIGTDTAHGSQSTVIEYPDYLVVIELPMIDKGGDRKSNLAQDIPRAENFLDYLKREYKNKPVKYVLSSHWHLHSLSGITPFFKQGATLVAAKTNWEYSVKNGLLDDTDTTGLEKQVIQVSKDTTILAYTNFPISVLFIDETYTHKPTRDFLFFYMPKNKCIHASCMCAIAEVDFTQRPEFVYSDRVIDLERAIKVRNLDVEHLFKVTGEFDKDRRSYKMPVIRKNYFEEFKQRGKPMQEVVKGYTNIELGFLQVNKDSILYSLITKKISPQIINSTVYACIKNKEYLKAVQWAQILNMYKIGDENFIDTLGEAYYNAGEITIAQHISNRLAELNPKFINQIKEWEKAKQAGN